MSVLRDYQKLELNDFRGADLLSEETDVASPWALQSVNVDFSPGNFSTRLGFYAHRYGLLYNGLVSTAFNWLYGSQSKIIWCTDDGTGTLKHYFADQNAAIATAFTPASEITPGGASYAQWGKFVYIAQYDSNFTSGVGLAILDMLTGNLWAAFAPPVKISTMSCAAVVAPTTGATSVTQGIHTYAVVFTDVTGQNLKPSPVVDTTGAPAYPIVTVTSAGQQITVTITPNPPTAPWRADLVKAYLVMSTATNQARLLYVAGVEAPMPAYPSSAPITFPPVTVPDVVLAEGDDIGDLETTISVDPVGNPPFAPYYVFSCGARMGYFGYQGQPSVFENQTYNVLISDPGDPQHITPDQHVFQLPQQRQPSAALYIQGTLYIFGSNWTYAYTDTGDAPDVWPTPRVVDGKIGTHHPYGISFDASGFGFVAHRTGLYVFSGGQYEQIPLSYYQTPLWNQIDWQAHDPTNPVNLQERIFNVVIDAERFRVVVFAKFIDGQRRMLVWDYTDGATPQKAKFSIHTPMALGQVRFGMIVMNHGDLQDSNYRQHLWVATSIATIGNPFALWYLARTANDSTPYLDGSANIPMTYQLPILPGRREMLIHEHHGIEARALGKGDLLITSYKLDLQSSQALRPTPLAPAPAKEFLRFLDLRSEGVSHVLQNGPLPGDYVVVSTIRHYHKPYMMQR